MMVAITRDKTTVEGRAIREFEATWMQFMRQDMDDWSASYFAGQCDLCNRVGENIKKVGVFAQAAAIFQAREPLPRSRSLTIYS